MVYPFEFGVHLWKKLFNFFRAQKIDAKKYYLVLEGVYILFLVVSLILGREMILANVKGHLPIVKELFDSAV